MSEQYKYHIAIYSKLIEGYDPMGPIVRGSEARVNGMTAGFPAHLYPFCQPINFFSNEPLITDIDPRIINGGAFVYAPLFVADTHYSVFARIQARSEGGEDEPGRPYSHCALIFVETHWEPGLLHWAAEMLFTMRHGGRCWGIPVAEYDEDREALPAPPLCPPLLMEDMPSKGPMAIISDTQIPPLYRGSLSAAISEMQDEMHPYVALSAQIGVLYYEYHLFVAGRWLSVGLGVGPGAKGLGRRDFFVRLDMRDGDQLTEVELPPFDDFNSAKIFVPIKSSEVPNLIDWSSLQGPARQGERYKELISDNMLWSFQREELRMEHSAHNAAEAQTEPAPATQMELAETPEAHFATDGYSNLDHARWPEMMLPAPPYLDQFDNLDDILHEMSYETVFDQIRIAKIRPALQQIVRRCQILDPPHDYDRLDLTADYEKLREGVQNLVEWVICYMVLADPKDLYEVLDDLLAHGPIKSIKVPAASRGGILQDQLSKTFEKIGHTKIIDWIEGQYRYESRKVPDLRRKGLLNRTYTVFNPQRAQIKAFFDWLKELEDEIPKPVVDCDVSALDHMAQDIADRVKEYWQKDGIY